MSELTFVANGPLFTGLEDITLRVYMAEAELALADRAYELVQQNLAASIVHSTPYYQTQIQVVVNAVDVVVNDNGVIYGPWLEGTGSRNQTTRFKGYSSFRRAMETVKNERRAICEPILQKYLGQL
jgi:hypothetical protein